MIIDKDDEEIETRKFRAENLLPVRGYRDANPRICICCRHWLGLECERPGYVGGLDPCISVCDRFRR